MAALKWYENYDIKEKSRFWWTQRDENGVCFEIRHRFAMFSLYVCEKYVGRYFSIDQAMKEAEAYKNRDRKGLRSV